MPHAPVTPLGLMATKKQTSRSWWFCRTEIYEARRIPGPFEAPEEIHPAPFRDFSVKTARPGLLVTERAVGRHGVGHGAPVFNAINAPPFGRPFTSHRATIAGTRVMHALCGPEIDLARRRCISSASQSRPGDLSAICGDPAGRTDRLPTGSRNRSGRTKSFGRCNASQRVEDCWYCSSEVNPLAPIDAACPPSPFIYGRTWRSHDEIILL